MKNTPTLFPPTDISLNTAQVLEIEKLLQHCPSFSLGFSIFKDAKGKTKYYSVLFYTDHNEKAIGITITKETFGEVVASVYEKIQSLNA
jgi:hypothetical protein